KQPRPDVGWRYDWDWHNWLQVETLVREAEGLMPSGPPVAGAAPAAQERTSQRSRRERADQLAIDHAVAVIRFDAAQKAEAESALRKIQSERAQLASEEPAHPDYQAQLADTLQALGQLLAETDRFEEGQGLLEQALRVRAKLADDHPGTRRFRE